MKVVSCKNCGASMEIDESRDFAFCSFCGTKILLNEKVTIDRNKEVANLLNRAYDYFDRNDLEKASEYCNRVLDIDLNNEGARELERKINELKPKDNVVVLYKSDINDKFKLRLTFDGRNWVELSPNQTQSFKLPVGTYNLMFSGKKSYTRRIVISDTRKVIKITYVAQRFKNDIIVE